MTQPTPYRRGYDFSDAGGATPPGGPLDGELDDIGLTVSQILRNLALIQRDDTALRNGIVGIDALDNRVLGLLSGGTFTIAGTWATATSYAAGAFFSDDEAIYLTMEAHTSVSIVDDLAAGHIVKVLQNEQGERLRDDFTGDGVTTVFTLSQSPARPADVEVYVEGLLVPAADYAQTGATVTFDVAPTNGDKISIFSIVWSTTPPIQTLVDAVGDRNTEISAATDFLQDVADNGGAVFSDALIAPAGGEMVGFEQTGSGSTSRDVSAKLLEMPVSAADKGAVGDGVTNDTAAILAMWNEAKASGRAMLLGKVGQDETRYLITPGVLEWTFDNSPPIDATGYPGPKLYTAGKVTLVSDGTADAPFIYIHNDPTDGGRYIQGGFIEDLCFEDTSVGGAATRRHGIELFGINGMTFGAMVSTGGLRGDLFHITEMGASLTADAWHVYNCSFDGATLWSSPYYAFNNDSLSQFFNYNHIGQIWALGAKGAFRGVGAANKIDGISVGWCSDIGVDLSSKEGSSQFCDIGFIEMDSPRYGLRVSGIQGCHIGALRLIYRNGDEWSSLGIPAGVTWPELPIEFAENEAGQVVSDFSAQVVHRFNDIVQAQLPAEIVSYANVESHRAISLTHRTSSRDTPNEVEPSPGLFLENINGNTSGIKVILNDAIISDTRNVNLCIARCTGRSGGSAYDGTDPVDFQSVQIDQASAWDASGKQWVCPASGVYSLYLKFLIQPDAADLVRVGFFLNGGTSPFRETHYIVPDGLGTGEAFPIFATATYPFSRGDTVKVCLYEATDRPLLGGSAGIPANNFFQAVMVQA